MPLHEPRAQGQRVLAPGKNRRLSTLWTASRATALAVVLISCTPTHSNLATAHAHSLPPLGTAPTQTGPLSTTISPRSPSTASSSASHATRHVPAGFGQRHITLACDDSAGDLPVGESGSNVMIAGAQLTGLTGGWDPSLTSEVGLVLPADIAMYFRKLPVYVKAGAGPVTLTVPGDHAQFGSWVRSAVWTSGSAPNLEPWAATSVTFQGCPNRGAMYLGGLLAASPTTCFPLSSRSTSNSDVTIELSLGGRCNA